MPRADLVEVFQSGSQCDAAGNCRFWSDEDLAEIAESYNSVAGKLHDAPIQIGHGEDQRALGWISRLNKIGNKLFASIVSGSDRFARDVNDQIYRKRSVSIYPKDHPNNPTPGKFNLRHLAFVLVPAIKGLKDFKFQFSDLPLDISCFNYEEIFMPKEMDCPFQCLEDLLRSMREQALLSNPETVDRIYPADKIKAIGDFSPVLQKLQEAMMWVPQLREEVSALHTRLEAVEALSTRLDMMESMVNADDDEDEMSYGSLCRKVKEIGSRIELMDKPDSTTPEYPEYSEVVDVDELTACFEEVYSDFGEGGKTDRERQLEETIATLQAEKDRLEVNSFVDGLVSEGYVLPQDRDAKASLLLAIPPGMGELREQVRADLRKRPALPNAPIADYSGTIADFQYSDPADLDTKIRNYAAQKGIDLNVPGNYAKVLDQMVTAFNIR